MDHDTESLRPARSAGSDAATLVALSLLTTVSENRAAHRLYASLGFETAYEVLLYDKTLAM